jgi:hypothetical protein
VSVGGSPDCHKEILNALDVKIAKSILMIIDIIKHQPAHASRGLTART